MDGCKIATCRLCEEPQVFKCPQNTTTPLWKHLEKKHKDEHTLIFKKRDPVRGVKKDEKLRQPTILDITSKKAPYGRNHHKQRQFDENLKSQIINDCVPFSTADSKSFRKTVKDLDPRIVVKSAWTYSRQIRKEGQKVKSMIKRLVTRNAQGLLAMTTDMWEDRKQNSFCSLTVHLIGEDFKLDRITPAIKYFGTARHRSVNIAATLTEEIEKVKAYAGISTVLVSDSTANMVKTKELLKERDVIDMEIGCSLHRIQNAIKDSNKATAGVKKTMTKAKKLIKFIRKSNPTANRLKTACSKTGHRHKKLKTCIDIRWNSEYDAFERLLYHQECLEDMDRSRDLDSISSQVLNRDQWRILQAFVDILKPVKIATKILETESEPSINRVAECLYDLDEGLKAKIENGGTPRLAKTYAKNLKNSLVKRFPAYGLNERLFGYGNFLDPHLKGIHVEKEKLMNAVTESVKGMISKFDVPEEIADRNEENTLEFDEVAMSATEKLLKKKRDPLSNVFEVESVGDRAAQEEIDVFKKLPSCGRKDDVLKWWAEHSNILPRLSILARWILAVPAGTASSERLFSIAGLF